MSNLDIYSKKELIRRMEELIKLHDKKTPYFGETRAFTAEDKNLQDIIDFISELRYRIVYAFPIEEDAIKCAKIVVSLLKDVELGNHIIKSIVDYFEDEKRPIYCSTYKEAKETKKAFPHRRVIVFED